MKKLTLRLLFLLPLLAGLILTNYISDPANLFSESLERKIADTLLSGKTAAGITNFDERKLQKYFISGLCASPDVCVFGSSRSLQIGTELFPDKVFFNNSVSGGSIQDYIAIYQLYRARGILPKKIIFGLDPWILNANNGHDRWQSLKPEYDKLVSDQFNGRKSVEKRSKYLQLISPAYFQQAIKSLDKNNQTRFRVTEEKNPSDGGIRYDGFRIYPETYLQTPQETVNLSARKYIGKKNVYGLNYFTRIDPQLRRLFEQLIALAQNDGIQISFFLSPYHPLVYDYLTKTPKYGQVAETEAYFINFAKQHNIPLTGSYNPSLLNLDEGEFYDGMHPKTEAVQKIFSSAP